MTVTYKVSEEISLTEISFVNNFTAEEAFKAFVGSFSVVTTPSNVLMDVTRSGEMYTMNEFERLANLFMSNKDKLKGSIAILVAQEVRYGIARQACAAMEGFGFRASPFYDRQEALEWLSQG